MGTVLLMHHQVKFSLKARFGSQFNLVHKSIKYLNIVFYMASDNEHRPAKNIPLVWKSCVLCQSIETVSQCCSHCKNTVYISSVLTLKHWSKRKRNQEGITPLKKKMRTLPSGWNPKHKNSWIEVYKFNCATFKKGRNTPVNRYSITEEKDYINICMKQNEQLHDTEEKIFWRVSGTAQDKTTQQYLL